MTPEQFRDCRTALRALRRVKRWRDFNIPVATGDFESVIRRGKRDLPEYRAMLEAKRRVRCQQALRQQMGALYRSLQNLGLPTFADDLMRIQSDRFVEDACADYREARAKFIERIGGSE